VPINISYDRLLESANMANEMITGDSRPNRFVEVLYKLLWRFKNCNIGDIYVKYLEPIHVKEFL